MKHLMKFFTFLVASAILILAGCAPAPVASDKKTIVVTYSILGSLVKDLVGDQFDVVVSMPNGLDPHEWEPSAKDIEALNKASLIVRNGLGLEGGMDGALAQAEAAGVPMFTASEHITIRTVKAGQGLPTGDPDQAEGAQDPHLWLAPLGMKAVVVALAVDLKSRFGIDLSARATDLSGRLDALDTQIRAKVAALPEAKRLLVTGHESLGYFAEAYGFTLVGAIIPSLTDQAEVSAADMVALKKTIQAKKVAVIFTELGTPPKVAQALGKEMNLKVVEITTHALLTDGSYFTFFGTLSDTIIHALQP
jgi:zinc/manganese transport system substrate-binding protein